MKKEGSLKEQERNLKKPNVFTAFIRLLPMVYKSAPVLFILTQILSILHGLSWGINTLFTQKFFDSAAQMVDKKAEISKVVISLIALGLINIINQVLNGVGNFVPQVFADKARGKLSFKINEKMGRISPICFEDTKMLDDINKAERGKDNSVWFILTFMIIFSFYIPYFAFMAFYLFSLKPILAISIVIIFIPTAFTQIIRTKVFAKLEDKSAPVRREYDYYEKCIVGREYFKETRLLGAFSYFRKLYEGSLVLLNKLSFRANLRTNLYELAMRIVTLAGYFGILYLLFDALMKSEITVGAFAAVFASIGMLYSIMEEVVCRHLGTIAQNLGTIQNFLNFLDIKTREGKDMRLSENADIHIKNVSFAYPNTETNAVDNVSFTIKNRETIAIVGENGSGKSTLIRLITGLYLPDRGDIVIGDINTKDVAMETLFYKNSAVFQKYQRYQLTLKDNIQISETDRNTDDMRLDKTTEMAGFNKNDESFTDGYDTMLSREFDGVDLSGGQWQRVAIARGFYRVHDMIILDEPTAAIDPFEETKIYNRFANISKGKTAIIVTHRLGSVKLADRILVMEKGRLVEIGTHDELIKGNGEYARLYKAQEQWYR
ncbi:MAG TPA: ABC transporter ATP-binding protein [Clostridiaceae bacterium]|nr:ABC transporter ATP-binding protein [Clostridiaceae bacterium]